MGGCCMIIVIKRDATPEVIEHVAEKIKGAGLAVHISKGKERTIIGAIGDEALLASISLEALPGVESVMPILKPSKPRTSPYDFQGLGVEGLKLLAEARKATGLPIISELMDPRDTDVVCQYVDIVQIGARNMQNFRLLMEVGKAKKPVLLKRGLSATIKEVLMSAEYIASQGNSQIILCERGIRTLETATRNTLDLSAVPVLKEETHLPIFIDPSHSAGRWNLVAPLAKAAIAVGADGLMIEVHPDPENALCDGAQSLKPSKFAALMDEIRLVAASVGRTLAAV